MDLVVETRDGASIRCSVTGAGNTGPVVLVAPAMGVRASFYDPLATALAGLGLTVVTADLRGNGGHSIRRHAGHDWGYEQMLTLDFAALVDTLRERFAARRLVWLGHSLGGQLGCLFAARFPGQIDGLILTGSAMVDWRGWGGARYKRLLQYMLIGGLTRLLGYFPGERMGFAGNEPSRQMRDWVGTAISGRYSAVEAPVDYEQLLGQVRIPLLAVTFVTDDYAPRAACELLLRKMPHAEVMHRDLSDDDAGLHPAGHFRWAREPAALLPLYRDWLEGHFGSWAAAS